MRSNRTSQDEQTDYDAVAMEGVSRRFARKADAEAVADLLWKQGLIVSVLPEKDGTWRVYKEAQEDEEWGDYASYIEDYGRD